MTKKKDVGGSELSYTEAQVAEAITESRGFISSAARRLKCSRMTIYRYIDRYPDLNEAVKDAREALLDVAEKTLYDKAITERDTTSLIFLLKTQGRNRGYVERKEISGNDGAPITIEFVPFDGDE